MKCPSLLLTPLLLFLPIVPLLAMVETPEIPDLSQLDPHPRLFFSPERIERIKANIAHNPQMAALADRVITYADEMVALEPIERMQEGRRILAVSRTCLKRINFLATAYHITGNERYMNAAEREMIAAAGFRDWNPSHFLDVGEMVAALGIGYDAFYAALPEESRDAIRQAIVELGLEVSFADPNAHWLTANHNWNQVCHGGLAIGALAVAEDHPDLAARVLVRSISRVGEAMAMYAPDGAYPEGAGYWEYGTSFNVLLIDALERSLGSDFGLSAKPGFLASADYYLHACGPQGMYFNYYDSGLGKGLTPAIFWFAATTDQPWLTYSQRAEIREFNAGETRFSADDRRGRFLPLLLGWADSSAEMPIPPERSWSGLGKTPVAFHRTSWTDPRATFFGIKGGKPGTNHGHMDNGSFVLNANGVRWAIDFGSESYHRLEQMGFALWGKSQDAQRWNLFRYSTYGHNTLVINGKQQLVDGFSTLKSGQEAGGMRFTEVDLTPAYANDVTAATRRAELYPNGSVVIHDTIIAKDASANVRWSVFTEAMPTVIRDGSLTLAQDGETLRMFIDSPAHMNFAVEDVAIPRTEFDSPNTGVSRVYFDIEVAPSEKLEIIVRFTPGS